MKKRTHNESEVFYTPNVPGKAHEEKRIRNSTFFYQKDVQNRLERDKRTWAKLAAGSSIDTHWLKPEDKGKITPLMLLERQLAEYASNEAFSKLALHGIFVPFYYPKEKRRRPKTMDDPTRSKTRDRRPERVVILRKHPSKALIKDMLPDDVKDGMHSSSTITYNPTYEYERGWNGSYDPRPEEDKVLEKLRLGGLDPEIQVMVAFVVPFYPSTKWNNNVPPPEHTEQFAPYLKYAITCHSRISVVVTLDKWSARYMMTGCNYDQMQYKPTPPEYGIPERKINLYPISSKTRTVRASGLKLIHLPHYCMWEGGKNPALKSVFLEGITRIQEGMVRSGQKNINAFDLMFRAAADNAISSTDIEYAKGFTAEISKNVEASVAKPTKDASPVASEPFFPLDKEDIVEAFFPTTKEENPKPRRERDTDEDTRLNLALKRAKVDRNADPKTLWLKTYDQNIWKIPENLKKFNPSIHTCDCPRCMRDTNEHKGCPWVEYTGEEDTDTQPCIWCCCKHGHRNPMGECPQGKGCRGWSIPPLSPNEKTLTQLYNKWKQRLYEFPMVISKTYTLGLIVRHNGAFITYRTISEYDRKEYTDEEHSFHAYATVSKIPTLKQLCIETIRRAASDTTYNPTVLTLGRDIMSRLPDGLIRQWFPPCAAQTVTPLKWLALNSCCMECFYSQTDPDHSKILIELHHSLQIDKIALC